VGRSYGAGLAADQRDGLLGDSAQRRRVEVVGRDDLLAGGDEEPQFGDALYRRETFDGGIDDRAGAGEGYLQVALGLRTRHDGDRLDGKAAPSPRA